jgi:hypothetical protein
MYGTRGKMKHQFYFLMKQTFKLFLQKNNMSVSLCPDNFAFQIAPFSPILTLKMRPVTIYYVQLCIMINSDSLLPIP